MGTFPRRLPISSIDATEFWPVFLTNDELFADVLVSESGTILTTKPSPQFKFKRTNDRCSTYPLTLYIHFSATEMTS